MLETEPATQYILSLSLSFFNIYVFIYLFRLCQVLVVARGIFAAACKLLVAACGIQFPDQGLNLGPLHWERGVLLSGPPGKPLYYLLHLTTSYHPHLYTPVWELATNISHLDYCKSLLLTGLPPSALEPFNQQSCQSDFFKKQKSP